MKRLLSFLLAVVMTLCISTVAFADYRGTVDGIELNAGLNPVVRVSEGTFDYVIYARDMTGMTNGDLLVSYDTDVLTLLSVKQTGNYSNSVYNDVDGDIYFSYLYSGTNDSDAVKLYILTFSYSAEGVYPELTARNIAGTFIKSVKELKVFEATDDNAAISEGTGRNDSFMQDDATYSMGDVNGDGEVTAADARLILRHSARLEILYLEQYLLADYNDDGRVTAADARLALRKSAGLE
ncbi:MAG: dockerin type I repeat-containing protein [Clostridia bacterium]|nr:dockerin type I repeat-containing protein [Clostridia bacterium]